MRDAAALWGSFDKDTMGGVALGSLALLLLGIFACSTSVIFIKSSETPPALLAAWRLFVAALCLAPLAWREFQRYRGQLPPGFFRFFPVPAFLLAAHFISWTAGGRMTPAANASLLVNLVPVVMPVIVWLMFHEKIRPREVLGTIVAMTGVAIIGWGNFQLDPRFLKGDLICFLSMLLFALYLCFGKKSKKFPGLWLYLVPMYGLSGLLCLLYGVLVSGTALFPANPREWGIIIGMGLIPTITGHSILNHSMKNLPSQVVSLFNLWQFFFAGLMAFFFFHEVPSLSFIVAVPLVLGGAFLVLRRS